MGSQAVLWRMCGALLYAFALFFTKSGGWFIDRGISALAMSHRARRRAQ
jgi:hypothetical protein